MMQPNGCSDLMRQGLFTLAALVVVVGALLIQLL